MGGAIALQVAADHAQIIDGLVCSVPSGSRFAAASTDVDVAFHLLANKNKPFDIGSRIVKQATKAESLRETWEKDPEARLQLSPLELLQFQRFMDRNLKAAERLKNLPVIIFQGYGDKLVRPEGTLGLYNALATEDKDLVFVGHSEHLIFEEGQFKPAVVRGLYGWLTSHLKGAASDD
jgi:alpha-beta hydrolase superfamily lysophospholipase